MEYGRWMHTPTIVISLFGIGIGALFVAAGQDTVPKLRVPFMEVGIFVVVASLTSLAVVWFLTARRRSSYSMRALLVSIAVLAWGFHDIKTVFERSRCVESYHGSGLRWERAPTGRISTIRRALGDVPYQKITVPGQYSAEVEYLRRIFPEAEVITTARSQQ